MTKVGLTGCIGSGKSISTFYFRRLGVPVVDADALVESFFTPGSEIFNEVALHFGDDILAGNKFINKQFLRDIIFNNDRERKWIESLIHPHVRKFIREKVEEIGRIRRQENNYCIVSVPLLPGLVSQYRLLDRICVVDSGTAIRINRIRLRDRVSYREIKPIILRQRSRESYLKIADDIIINGDNSLSCHSKYLKSQVYKLHGAYIKISK